MSEPRIPQGVAELLEHLGVDPTTVTVIGVEGTPDSDDELDGLVKMIMAVREGKEISSRIEDGLTLAGAAMFYGRPASAMVDMPDVIKVLRGMLSELAEIIVVLAEFVDTNDDGSSKHMMMRATVASMREHLDAQYERVAKLEAAIKEAL